MVLLLASEVEDVEDELVADDISEDCDRVDSEGRVDASSDAHLDWLTGGIR